ncbi:Hypothetical predicted protein [Paramuricea clavata]|uniref:Uncharacterized protein n=1 Tax=Paramuricea clavata TaxID=317549 RepID=A0A7D9HWC2_PARCT|nr:Hypothetical predicted protein [Paramuricea clavata]
MLKSLNQFTKFLFIFIVVARISGGQLKKSNPKERRASVQTNMTTAQPNVQLASSTTRISTSTSASSNMSKETTKSTKSLPARQNTSAPMIRTKFFILLVILCPIVALVLFKYCKRKNSDGKVTQTVEVRPVSATSSQCEVQTVSPLYCEVDIFQFPSREQTSETVETDIDEPADVEGNLADEYYYPENIDDEYETMNPINPRQASGEYACAYDHVNINAGYMNAFPCKRPTSGVEDDDYEYPQNRRSSSDNEYRYAYDWLDPDARVAALSACEPVQAHTSHDKDEVNDNFYENYQTLSHQTLSRESLHENENETVPLEYVAVM